MNAGYPEYATIDDGVSINVFAGRYRATARQWLVRRLIRKIHRGGSIWGLPGQGKGVVVIFLIVGMLYGFEIGGRKAEKIAKIMYVDGEDDADEFANRVVAACAGWSALLGEPVPVPRDDQLIYANVAVDDFHDPTTSRKFREAINAAGADVVIYDAIQSIFGGNQNTGEVGGYVWAWIKRTAIEGDHVPLAIDHSGWQGKHESGTVQKRGRVGQSLQVALRAGSGKILADGAEEQIIDLYLRKSNYQVSPGEETPVLSVRTTFTRTPDLIEGDHDPEDAMGPTLFEFVDPPEPATATIGLLIEILEEQGETTEAELAVMLGKSADAIRKAIEREQKRGSADAKRLVVTKNKNPKTWGLK